MVKQFLFVALALAALSGCVVDNEGPAERLGESIDRSTGDVGDAIEDFGDRVEDAAEDDD